jgi:Ca2+/H+ antiporter
MIPSVDLDYEVVMYMVIGIFALVGFLRGWWKEAITTGLLTILLIIVMQPDTAQGLVESIDGIAKSVGETAGSLVGSGADTFAAQSEPVVDASSQSTYVIILIVLVLVSYFTSKIGLTQNIGAGARVVGGLLGMYNGYVIITLVREFLTGRLVPGNMFAASGVAATEMSIRVNNMPTKSITDPPTVYFIIGIGVLVFLFAIISAVKIERSFKISRQPPPLHK